MDHYDLSSIRKDKLARKGEDTIDGRHSAVQMRDEAQGRVTFMITTCRNAYTVAVRQGFAERGTIIGWFITCFFQLPIWRSTVHLLDRRLPPLPVPLSWNLAAKAKDVRQVVSTFELTKSRWSRPFLFLETLFPLFLYLVLSLSLLSLASILDFPFQPRMNLYE